MTDPLWPSHTNTISFWIASSRLFRRATARTHEDTWRAVMAETIILQNETDFASWRGAARRLALGGIAPENTIWSVGDAPDLFAGEATGETDPPAPGTAFSVPRAVLELAETVIQANDPARFALLYGLIYRTHRGEKHLLQDVADPLVQRLQRLAQSVRRDTHKMRAFLRFRAVEADGVTCYVAWFEPAHFIVEANAQFFIPPFRGP